MTRDTTELRQIKQMLIGIEITIVGVGIGIVGIGYVSTSLLGVGLLVTACGVGYTALLKMRYGGGIGDLDEGGGVSLTVILRDSLRTVLADDVPTGTGIMAIIAELLGQITVT